VEGNFDLLLLAVHGIGNTVAPLGTALTREHIRALRGYGDEAVLLFDADAAGLKAAMRSIPYFLAEQVEARVALLPAGHDPDSYVRAEGPQAVAALVDAARPLAEFAFDALVRAHGLTLTGKNRIIAELKDLIKEAANPEQRALMTAHFSEKLGVAPGYFQSGPAATRNRQTVREEMPVSEGLARLPAQERHLVEFLILYPEYFNELLQAGLANAIREPAALRLIDLMTQMDAAISRQPEQLLVHIEDANDRAYIVRILTRDSPYDADREQTRNMCDALVRWVRSTLHKRAAAELQEAIRRAESLGDKGLLMELIARKQEMEQKKEIF